MTTIEERNAKLIEKWKKNHAELLKAWERNARRKTPREAEREMSEMRKQEGPAD